MWREPDGEHKTSEELIREATPKLRECQDVPEPVTLGAFFSGHMPVFVQPLSSNASAVTAPVPWLGHVSFRGRGGECL